MAQLSLRRVSKTYDSGVQALSPVDLEVADGQLVVLVGPSGCGKSTLLRIIAGLEQSTGGELLIDGKPVTDTAPKDRDVAMVFQNYALYPHLTVRQNLEFALKMRGVPQVDRDREVTMVAELLGLNELLNRRPPQLSGGQQQRVALGRAIVRRPKLFLLDEPFSNLDATLRASTRTEILRLHRRLHATTIFVTHDQIEAMSMADVLVVLKAGVVQQTGAPLDVYRRPANQFVAQFIGFPPMNLIEGVICSGGHAVEVAGTRVMNPTRLSVEGDRVTLGLRAEHITTAAKVNMGSNDHLVNGKIILLEPLGNEILATCLAGGQDLIMRLPASTSLRPGQEVRLALNMEEAVWFDPASGDALEESTALFKPGTRNALDEVALQENKQHRNRQDRN